MAVACIGIWGLIPTIPSGGGHQGQWFTKVLRLLGVGVHAADTVKSVGGIALRTASGRPSWQLC